MPTIAARFTLLVSMLRTAIGVFVAREARPLHVAWLGRQVFVERRAPARLPPLPEPVWALLQQRLLRLARRFQALFDRWQSNTLPKPRPRRCPRLDAGPSRTPRKPTPRLPRAFAWVNYRIPESAPPSGWLESLLHDPDTKAFVQAAPQAGRLLRPLCTALGQHHPDWLKLPPRPRKPRKPRPLAPLPPASLAVNPSLLPPHTPPQPDRPLEPYVAAAAKAWKKKYDS
jgi:hypothetical protein